MWDTRQREARFRGRSSTIQLIKADDKYQHHKYVRVKIIHICVALNHRRELLLNQAPCPDLFYLPTIRYGNGIN